MYTDIDMYMNMVDQSNGAYVKDLTKELQDCIDRVNKRHYQLVNSGYRTTMDDIELSIIEDKKRTLKYILPKLECMEAESETDFITPLRELIKFVKQGEKNADE